MEDVLLRGTRLPNHCLSFADKLEDGTYDYFCPYFCLEREKLAWKDISLLQNQIYCGFVPIYTGVEVIFYR